MPGNNRTQLLEINFSTHGMAFREEVKDDQEAYAGQVGACLEAAKDQSFAIPLPYD